MVTHKLVFWGPNFRGVKSTLTPILLKSIEIHLPFLSRYFCKSMPSSWQNLVYTPPICITIRLPFVSRYFCRSIRVRGRWDTPKKWGVLGEGQKIHVEEVDVLFCPLLFFDAINSDLLRATRPGPSNPSNLFGVYLRPSSCRSSRQWLPLPSNTLIFLKVSLLVLGVFVLFLERKPLLL